MKKIIKKMITRVPKEYKDEFNYEIYKENLLRLVIAAAIMLVFELVIFLFFKERIFSTYNTNEAVMVFIIFDVIMLPIIYALYKNYNKKYKKFTIKIIQHSYLFVILVFGSSLALLPQKEFQSIHIYIIAVFAIAAFFHLYPLESILLFFSAYLVFFYALPYHQTHIEILTILRINGFVMNFIAWIFSRMVFRMRIISFLDKKEIMEKVLLLNDMAIRDSMTSLLNHGNVYRKLSEEIEKAKHMAYPLSIIMMDIDNFKFVNDNYGHLVGDSIIIQVAQTLVNTCRATDIVGRYGGEEFIVILPKTPLSEAVLLAEQIRSTIQSSKFKNDIEITISGGISEYDNNTAEDLIKSADLLLLKAKANGKNRFETI